MYCHPNLKNESLFLFFFLPFEDLHRGIAHACEPKPNRQYRSPGRYSLHLLAVRGSNALAFHIWMAMSGYCFH